jgi:hypothetical protein
MKTTRGASLFLFLLSAQAVCSRLRENARLLCLKCERKIGKIINFYKKTEKLNKSMMERCALCTQLKAF